MSNLNVGEQLLSDVVSVLFETYPDLSVEETKNKLSSVISKYHVKKVEIDSVHPDLHEKIDLFLASKKLEGLSPITLKGYRYELNSFANHVKKRVEEITTADIRTYLGKYQQDLKMSSIGSKLTVHKSFFNWLTGEEYIQRNPTTKIKSPKTEKRMTKALTIEELEMIREACETPRQRAFVEVLYATAGRLSEIHALNRSDVNYQTMSAKVIGKGNKEREVLFSFKAIYHLNKYLKSRTDDCEALFVTERKPSRRLSPRAIEREIEKIAKNAGIKKKVTPHTFRHTFGSLTLNNGAELAAVQAMLGHADPATTQIYAQITDEKKREQYKKFLVQ